MVRLKSRTMCPPGGFLFYQPETQWSSLKAAPETRWDFKQLVKAVREHRIKHSHLGLSLDRDHIMDEVDAQNAARISELDTAESFIVRDSQPGHCYFFSGVTPSPPDHATANDVSAVIAIYKPSATTLNRCLSHLVPQVGDIVVVVDTAGAIPEGALIGPAIRYVTLNAHDVGYGRKANYGVRYCRGRYIWFLNDDVFVSPDCCEQLLDIIRRDESVGMVGHELRYPDGTLQHGGTARGNFLGFGHMDKGKRESGVKEPIEVENVTGASVIVRHAAFFQAGQFLESYYLYCEDNDLCLSIRRAGWRIIYTPHAKAEHMEHQSTAVTPGMQDHLRRSLKIFEERWGKYFDKNKKNPGLGVFQ